MDIQRFLPEFISEGWLKAAMVGAFLGWVIGSIYKLCARQNRRGF